ncbi:mitochondrial intermediate peptidase-like [Branchiostoma floridae x Branchiostoma belcheri]
MRNVLIPCNRLVRLLRARTESSGGLSSVGRGVWSRDVATWSPLGTAFNTKTAKRLNLFRENVGLFEVPELTSPAGFQRAEAKVAAEAAELVKATIATETGIQVVQLFDKLSDTLCRVADLADCIRVVHPNAKFAHAAQQTCFNIGALVEQLNTNIGLYDALKRLLHNDAAMASMDEESRRVAELFMFDFEISGIHLPDLEREFAVRLNEDILTLGSDFSKGVNTPNAVPKSVLPEHLKYCFSVDGDKVIVQSMHSDSGSDAIREAAYKLYLHPNPQQERVLEALLTARHKLAQLVGYPTFAHRTLKGTMARDPETVMSFLKATGEGLIHRTMEEFSLMRDYKAKHNPSSPNLQPWDPPYYSAFIKADRFKIDPTEYAPYFSLGACMEGLNHLFSQLYRVSLQPQETHNGEVWDSDVKKLAVMHETEGILGYIYCDFFQRPGKPHHDCHFTIRGGRQLDNGDYQIPVVVLMLHYPPPSMTKPTLLTPGMMENLFHEMGHAMHSMLARTRYQHVTGTRCSTDFAEVPSVLMEYFASDYRVLSQFARHYQTDETLPEDMLKKLCESKKLFQASELQQQVLYAIVDQVYHGKHPLGKSTTDIFAELQNKYYGLPHVPGTAWQLRFNHLVGYGAKYYSYIMSRAVASRLWHQCFKDDPFSGTMGERYRREMLAHGGGKDPKLMVESMLQKQLSTEDLVQSLLDDLGE